MFFICRLTDEEGFVLVYQFDQVVEEALCPFAFTSRFSPSLPCSYVSYAAMCTTQDICEPASGKRGGSKVLLVS